MRCNVQFSNLGEKEKQWCARGKIYFFSSTSVNGLESKGWSLIDMHTMSRYADCMHMKCGQWPICWYAFKGMVVVVGVRTCRINTVIVLTFNLIVKLKSNKAQMGKYFHQSYRCLRDVGVGFLQCWHWVELGCIFSREGGVEIGSMHPDTWIYQVVWEGKRGVQCIPMLEAAIKGYHHLVPVMAGWDAPSD